MDRNKRLSLIIISAVVFALIVVVVIILWIIDLRKSATISIAVMPSSAIVKLNGISYSNGNEHRIEPGEYEVEISRGEFKTYNTRITATTDQVAHLYIRLELESGGNLTDWYATHPDENTYATRLGDWEYDQATQKALEANPVLEYLPYSDTYYSLYTFTTDKNEIGINIKINMHEPTRPSNIKAAEYYKEEALNKLREFGLNPDDFEITYSWD